LANKPLPKAPSKFSTVVEVKAKRKIDIRIGRVKHLTYCFCFGKSVFQIRTWSKKITTDEACEKCARLKNRHSNVCRYIKEEPVYLVVKRIDFYERHTSSLQEEKTN